MTEAFGATAAPALNPIGAPEAKIYRFEIDGEAYVVRLDNRSDSVSDRHRHLTCAVIAGEGGIGPRVVYGSAEEGVIIASYIVSRTTPWAPGARKARLKTMAELVGQMHALPLFPRLKPYMALMDERMAQLAATPCLAETCQAAVQTCYRKLSEIYPRDGLLVSSHNDLNPTNLLFDGTRTWIVDWESAFAADPYVDIATLANHYADDLRAPREIEDVMVLEAALGAVPTSAQIARLFLMRQLNWLFYGAVLAINSWPQSSGRVETSVFADIPCYTAARRAMTSSELHGDLLGSACMFLKEAVVQVESPAFAQAARAIRG